MTFLGPMKEQRFPVKLPLQNLERQANSEIRLPEIGAAAAMNWWARLDDTVDKSLEVDCKRGQARKTSRGGEHS